MRRARLPRFQRSGALVCLAAGWYLAAGVPAALSQGAAKNGTSASQDTAKKAGATAAPQDTSKKTAAKAPGDSTKAAADSSKPLTPDQLDALVAPIALYP